MARIGLLTGGGDCPGLNAVIRAVVRKGINTYGHEFVGFRYGWAGVLGCDAIDLDAPDHERDPASRRHDPRHLAHERVQGGATGSSACRNRSPSSGSTR